MAMEERTKCAVPECMAPISDHNNLCDTHRVPGAIVRVGKSTMVITIWYAEHTGECGVIFLNDWALGSHFGGGKGFEEKLREQGFAGICLLLTPEEFEAAKAAAPCKKVGDWSGPWCTRYAWETRAHQGNDTSEDLQ